MRTANDEIPEALRPPTEEQLLRIALKVSEAATTLGICERTLKALGGGGPPFLKCGVTRLYPVESLKQWAIAMAAVNAELPTGRGGSDEDATDEVD